MLMPVAKEDVERDDDQGSEDGDWEGIQADDEGEEGEPGGKGDKETKEEGEAGERVSAEREPDFVRGLNDAKLPTEKEVEDHKIRDTYRTETGAHVVWKQ